MSLFFRRIAQPLRAFYGNQHGDVLVEYVLLFGTVALPLIPVLMAAGLAIVRNFESARNLLLLPMP